MAHRTWNQIVGRALVVGLLCSVLGLPVTEATAAPDAAAMDINADQRSLVEQLTAERAITLARERRLSDAAQEALYKQLEAKDRAQRTAEARAAGNAAALARVRKARDEIARQRQDLVAALAQRDRTLAAEVKAYREEVTKIASSPDPQKQQALQRFADGEQREALAEFRDIANAKRAARDKASNIADAAERRPAAWLAVQARDAGKVTLEEVVEWFEQLTRLDPGMTSDWIELARLYDEQGRLDDARKADETAYLTLAAGDERQRATVLTELGNIAVKAGDLRGAKARFEESLVIDRRFAKDNPTSAVAQRDLLVSLFKLGRTTSDRALLRDALQIAHDLEQTGRLVPRDHDLLDMITNAIDSIP